MSAALPIFATDDVRARYGTDALLASLPLSYRPQTDPATGGVVVVGGSANWPEEAASAIRAGTAGVIVIDPEPADLRPLRAPDTQGATVVVDAPWASNPVVGSAGDAFRAAATAGGRLECRVIVTPGRSLDGVLLGQLSLVRALLGPVTDLLAFHRSGHGYNAQAHAYDVAVDLSAVCTDAVAEHASARLLTADGSVEVHIPAGQTAEPALLTVTGPHGTTLAPTRYESGHRATWRRLHRLISHGEQSTDIDDLEADIRAALPSGVTEG
jgi:hypothetical protein